MKVLIMDLDSSIGKTLAEIQNVMNTNSIVGNPIKANDKIIIPISKTALGFGVGVATNDGNSNNQIGGAGGGGSIDPVAFVIVYTNIPGPDGVEVVPIENNNMSLGDLFSDVGKIVFDLIGNSKVEPATDVSSESNIEKIKTKIKPKSSDDS